MSFSDGYDVYRWKIKEDLNITEYKLKSLVKEAKEAGVLTPVQSRCGEGKFKTSSYFIETSIEVSAGGAKLHDDSDSSVGRKSAVGKTAVGKSTHYNKNTSNKTKSYNKTKSNSSSDDEHVSNPKKKKEWKEEEFDEFWKAYPKKQGKKEAKSRWNGSKFDSKTIETIMLYLEAYKASVANSEKCHILLPATFLNKERWNDEEWPEAPRSSPSKQEASEDKYPDAVEDSAQVEAQQYYTSKSTGERVFIGDWAEFNF